MPWRTPKSRTAAKGDGMKTPPKSKRTACTEGMPGHPRGFAVSAQAADRMCSPFATTARSCGYRHPPAIRRSLRQHLAGAAEVLREVVELRKPVAHREH